jgi:uncharacterized integral membrane protein
MAGKDKARLIILGLVGLYLLFFLLFNASIVEVHFVFFKISIPIFFLILFSVLIGAGLLWGFSVFQSFRRKNVAPTTAIEAAKPGEVKS